MSVNGSGSRGIVVITGASTGIGRACALRLDGIGFQVVAGVRKAADGEALAEGRPRITPMIIDVTDAETIRTAAGKVEAMAGGGGIAGLVNNAGIGVGGPLEFISIDDLRRQFEVNLFGQVAVTQAFLPLLRKGRGRIVNMGSVGGRMSTPFIGPYCASKFALEAITDALRMELRPWGINVAIVEPGSIATPIWDKGKATTDRIDQEISEEGRALYGPTLTAMRTFIEDAEKRAIPADRVAKAVAHALAAKRPKTRYLVGTDARLQAAMAAVVPDRIADRLILQQLKVPR